jgi:hypothetical protein
MEYLPGDETAIQRVMLFRLPRCRRFESSDAAEGWRTTIDHSACPRTSWMAWDVPIAGCLAYWSPLSPEPEMERLDQELGAEYLASLAVAGRIDQSELDVETRERR